MVEDLRKKIVKVLSGELDKINSPQLDSSIVTSNIDVLNRLLITVNDIKNNTLQYNSRIEAASKLKP